MNFEDLQKAWQSQNPSANVTIKAELLLKEVRRNQHYFRATIFWRDVREVGVAFLLALYFFYKAWTAATRKKMLGYGSATIIATALACLTHSLGFLLPFLFILWIVIASLLRKTSRKRWSYIFGGIGTMAALNFIRTPARC